MGSTKHFIHREHRPTDPEFLHEERSILNAQLDALHLMERQRDQLQHDIEAARQMAHGLGISLNHAPESGYRAWLALIGVGNRFRRDDAAGLEVAARLRATHPPGCRILEEEGEPGSLIEGWALVKEALVVDAVSTGAEPGTLHRFDATAEPLPAELFRSSTHALGVADAVELARELDRLPARLAVYGIEGEDFETGEGAHPRGRGRPSTRWSASSATSCGWTAPDTRARRRPGDRRRRGAPRRGSAAGGRVDRRERAGYPQVPGQDRAAARC